MLKVIIIASELSIITGHNKYEKIQKAIDSVLNRSGIVQKYIPKSKIEEKLLSLSEEDLQLIKKELKLDENATIKQVEIVINQQILSKSLNENITEEQSKVNADKVLKKMPILNKCLEVSVKQDLRMQRGNIKEDNNLNKTQIKRNIVIDNRNSQMFEKELYKDPEKNYSIILRGKIDGMNDDYIVETKNRTKRLFNMIPEYEKVQLNAYMFMTNKKKALHIECYNEEQNSVEYDFDEVFWENCSTKIINFTNKHILC
tara:strand:+ start:762 stop:1535 length:774 start_codon:yes stop_codon:yes gene_type:complete